MSDIRRIALSDPLQGRPARFVVGGQASQSASGDVKLYEWHKEHGQMGMVGLQTDVGQIRALSWAPFPSHRNLIAAGLSTGRTTLLSLSPSTLSQSLSQATSSNTIAQLSTKHSRPVTSLSFSPVDPNYLATGYERHRSDYSLLVWDISDAIARNQTLPNDNDNDNRWHWQRPVGRLEVTNLQTPAPGSGSAARAELRPIQQYCPSEHVNSLSFLPDTIYHLLASTNNKSIRLYDLRVPTPQPSSVAVASPANPSTSSPAGSNTGAGGSGSTSQWFTRAVNGLTCDPSREYRFASWEANPGTGVVKVWDTRRPGVELLSFDVAHGGVVGMQWIEDGSALAVGLKEGGVGVWSVVDGRYEGERAEEWVTLGGMRQVVKPKQTLQSFAFASDTEGRSDVLYVGKDGTLGVGPVGVAPILASSSRDEISVFTPAYHLVSPDVPPSASQLEGSADKTGRDANDGDTEADDDADLDDAASITFEDYKRQNRFQLPPEGVSRLLAEAGMDFYARTGPGSGGGSRTGTATGANTPGSSRLKDRARVVNEHEELVGGWEGLRTVVRGDIGFTMRSRAEEGYGLLNLRMNAAIATRYHGSDRLAGMWEFVTHLTAVMSPSHSTHRGINITYHGILAIWTSLAASPTSSHPRRETVKQSSAAWNALSSVSPYSAKDQQSKDKRWTGTGTGMGTGKERDRDREFDLTPEMEATFSAAVEAINRDRNEIGHIGSTGSSKLPVTEKVEQRRMMLAVCGEGQGGVMHEVERLVDDDQRTKAACWAYFAGEEEPAVNILMNSAANEKHRLMGTTIAGFMSQSRAARGSEFWNQHWRSLTNKVDDPYIRAVLVRIGGDDWEGILAEEAIPLLDRVVIAVCNLSDKELTHFLRERYTRCLRHASLHGLLLTGFTPLAIPLIQSYLDRTGDLQTAALLSSYFPIQLSSHGQPGSSQAAGAAFTPTEKKQVERWVEEYRDLLDSWKMFGVRSAFDVARLERARMLGSSGAEEEGEGSSGGGGFGDKRRICPACNNQVTSIGEEHIHRKSVLRRPMAWPNERTTTCALCTSVLPRCAICLMLVQTRFQDPWDSEAPSLIDTLDEAYVCCLTCRHGGHANHIIPWFNGGLDNEPAHDTCPVSGCVCQCAAI